MTRKFFSVMAAAALLMVLTAGPALADTVGVPGTPNCFGERISHGSAVHGLTPPERAAMLGQEVESLLNDPSTPQDLKDFILAFFGDDGVSVQEMTSFVRANCSDNPIVGP